ncbi:hypothetical protein [Companilactobacillus heilongjiangensis]|uniref:DUF1659 domain-containing protein n=1 Tax=Companilactobacillus heilongjiangensis TaxID=1074467 RepID=A0A0K2LEC8_9LACO|nr:hypothetical protein [Companilactobacillus heilongjiangensis]ALB29615.1 hypothetical protein JP39_09760 [Companilactobacillus heilongjiangensis]
MSWKKTAITITMGNDKYPKGIKVIRFNNIVEEPTKEQLQQFAEGLVLLSDGDSYLGSEIVKYTQQSAK